MTGRRSRLISDLIKGNIRRPELDLKSHESIKQNNNSWKSQRDEDRASEQLCYLSCGSYGPPAAKTPGSSGVCPEVAERVSVLFAEDERRGNMVLVSTLLSWRLASVVH